MTETKLALVTGAAKGIGLAIGKALYRDGWRVVLADRDAATLNETVRGFADTDRIVSQIMDVSDVMGVQRCIAELGARFGNVDCLVNNAGVFRNEPFLTTNEETYDRIMDINLKGTFFAMQAGAKVMVESERGGVIINIASAAGRSGRSTQAVYGLSKAGMIHLTKSAALAFGPLVRTFAVCPAAIESDMWQENLAQRRALGGEADVQAFMARIPLKRAGTPEEVAELVAFLASDKAAFMTGATLDLSGGLEM